MIEIIGVLVMSVLVWVLIKAMGAEKSEIERGSRCQADTRAEQPVRHAA